MTQPARTCLLNLLLLIGLNATLAIANPRVAVIVNDNLEPFIQTELAQYQQDLIHEGYNVTLKTWTLAGSTPSQLKDYLISLQSQNLVGAVFVGDLPIAIYYHANDFSGSATFPCDLYFMNLNGTWSDSDHDSKFETITGDSHPQIWVSRLVASNLSLMGSEEDIMKTYFLKNHNYRTGTSVLPRRGCALIYTTDWPLYWGDDLAAMYSTYEKWGGTDFTRTNYRAKLTAGYEFIYLCAHSSASYHQFSDGNYYNSSIPGDKPQVNFYNLYACSNCDYTLSNYMGGCYVSVTTSPYGLLASGSTKTGGMLDTNFFTQPLGQHKSFGEAFKAWWLTRVNGYATDFYVEWFYGLVLLGDGTLTISPQAPLPTSTYTLTATKSPTFTKTTSPTETSTPSITPTSTISPYISCTISPTATSPTATPTTTSTPTLTPSMTRISSSLYEHRIIGFPNPCREEMQFILNLESPAEVKIHIYNLAGELVTVLVRQLSGPQASLSWECASLANGIYLVRVLVNDQNYQTFKIAIAR